MVEYAGILIFGALAAATALFMLFANAWFGPKKPSAIKSAPFECGVNPIALPAGRLPVHFYTLAMLFVVFDVELVFLFPWAVIAKELSWAGIVEMGFFLLIVMAGFVYAWKHGALEFE